MREKLTTAFVRSIDKKGRYGDGGGLYLHVVNDTSKAWVFRYERGGRERRMGLGPARIVSLARARDLAKECAAMLYDGIDPIEGRRAQRSSQRSSAAKAMTFREAAVEYVAAHRAGWKNAKHAAQVIGSLKAHVFPTIGDLEVAAIDKALVLKCLKPIWPTVPETASRVRGRIEAVLNWASANGFRPEGENPARWKGHLSYVLAPRPRARHHSALPFAELPEFLTALRGLNVLSARALEFTILTAARTGEVIGTRWNEIDADSSVWTVPAGRMKSGREHRVPLSDQALRILRDLPAETGNGDAADAPPSGLSERQARQGELFPAAAGRPQGFVFVGARKGSGLSNMAMLETLRRMGRSDLTVHGFRSTFRDWAAETTAYPNHVVEMALAHAIGDKVEKAYRRGDLFDKRQRLMAEWARYCDTAQTAGSGNVVAIRGNAI